MLLDIIYKTPIWVFGLLIGLLVLGWQQTRSREITQRVALFLPLGMIALSLSGIISSFYFNSLFIVFWMVGVVLSIFATPFLLPKVRAKYDDSSAMFTVEGSWIPMVIIMCIFFAKYLTGVVSAIAPQLLDNLMWVYAISLVYGMLSGIFVSRSKQLLNIKSPTT